MYFFCPRRPKTKEKPKMLQIVLKRNSKVILKTTPTLRQEDREIKRSLLNTDNPLQVKWENDQIVHLHCISCNNPWGLNYTAKIKERFQIEKDKVTCKGCNDNWNITRAPH